MRELAEESVGTEADGAVGCLSSGGWDEALEETSDAAFAGDDRDGVEKSTHARVGALAVVDSIYSISRVAGGRAGESGGERGGERTRWS